MVAPLGHDNLLAEFGVDYLESATLSNQHLFPRHTRTQAAARIASEPTRYPRSVDALMLDELAALICKQDAYTKFFAACMRPGFAAGREHLRSVLARLVPIRNALSHGNPITLHDAERALCYCDDIIATLTAYYTDIGMSQEYDAPSFTRLIDSMGHAFHATSTQSAVSYQSEPLRMGDVLRLEAEVDAHYPPADYTVHWILFVPGLHRFTGSALELRLEPMHVSEQLLIEAQVISTKSWHRHGIYDARIHINYKVLPSP